MTREMFSRRWLLTKEQLIEKLAWTPRLKELLEVDGKSLAQWHNR